MAFGVRNEVKIDPFSYNIGIIGESGIGKTTITKILCEKYLPKETSALFLECGKEQGADAIQGINYVNCPAWSMPYDEYNNAVGFIDVVNDILMNKTREYPDLRVVVIDTYDELIDIAKREVVEMHNRLNPDKQVKTIKAAFGGFMAGEDKATEMVLDALWNLKKVGVSFIVIGHTKSRTQVDPVTGNEYNSLTTNMSIRDFNAIKTKLHFLGVAYIDRSIIQEKTGKKDATGKPIQRNVVAKESRRVTFRDDNYSVDSKSRFADIAADIPLDADAIYNALMDAIKSEASKSGKSFEEVKANQEKKNEQHVKAVAESEQKAELENKIEEIMNFFRQNKSDQQVYQPILNVMRELGYSNPNNINKMEDADKILNAIANR